MIILFFLLACSPLDGADWTGTGGWAHVRSPPGYEHYDCWVWATRGYPATEALGGPECFPKEAP